jgi:LAGLIDADG endonuclease
MLSQNGNILKRKLHSMRETPQKLWTTRHKTRVAVTMFKTRGQYAWFSTFSNQERSSMENHQRLNVEKHSQEWQHHWLVGLVDGDGTFTVDRETKPTGTVVCNLGFIISLNRWNARALYKAKTILGAGHVTSTPDHMITLRIRDREILEKHVFPLFDRTPLLSNKHYDYVKVREVARLLNAPSLDTQTRHDHIEKLFSQPRDRNAIAPVWTTLVSTDSLNSLVEPGQVQFSRPHVETIMTLPWLSGFLEAEGSFYITKKDAKKGRFCHAFGLSQTGNAVLMHAVRSFLKIRATVKHRKPESFQKFKPESQSFYSLETTNWRSLQWIKHLFSGQLLGMKSFEFRLWERSMKHRDDHKKLQEMQHTMRQIKSRFSESKKGRRL